MIIIASNIISIMNIIIIFNNQIEPGSNKNLHYYGFQHLFNIIIGKKLRYTCLYCCIYCHI